MNSERRQALGRLLADARLKSRMSGTEVSDRAGISQSKLSKIETGVYPKIETILVNKLLNILKPEIYIQQQVTLLLNDDSAGGSPAKPLNDFDYEQVYRYEHGATQIKNFAFNAVPAILQIAEYRQTMLKKYVLSKDLVVQEATVQQRRQDLLWDTNRHFHFILAETALHLTPGGPLVQLKQLDRLERLVGRSNIRLGIVPYRTGLTVLEHGNFVLYDDQVVKQAMLGTEIDTRSEQLVNEFVSVFTELQLKAVYDELAVQLIRQAMDYIGSTVV
jgi:transcriptional regulator with XRE-family HTH domain